VLPDFPEHASFLTSEERVAVRARLQADVGASAHETAHSWRDVLGVFRDCVSLTHFASRSPLTLSARRQDLPRRVHVPRADRPRVQLRVLLARDRKEPRLREHQHAATLRPALGVRVRGRHGRRVGERPRAAPLGVRGRARACRRRRLRGPARAPREHARALRRALHRRER
jgi:hypothetical protein